MENQSNIDAGKHRLDKWAVIYPAPTSVPLELKPTGSVFRGMDSVDAATEYAEQVAAFFCGHGVDTRVFVVRGPTSTSRCKFEVVTATAGYPVIYRTMDVDVPIVADTDAPAPLSVLQHSAEVKLTKPCLNAAQMKCLEFYANGDFEHLAALESEAQFNAALRECGDGLLRFLMAELASSEDCDSVQTAMQRLDGAIEDIKAVQRNVSLISAETAWEALRNG